MLHRVMTASKQLPYSAYLDALLAGSRVQCSDVVKNRLEGDASIKSLYEEVIKESMYQVGVLWEYNKISVATEHMASAITQAVMNELYGKILSGKKAGKKVVAACVENEFHQIGIRMVADIFEMHGWEAVYLGANVPVEELISFARFSPPDVIALSLSIYFNLPVLEQMIRSLRAEFPLLKIMVGGQAFLHGGREVLHSFGNIYIARDLNEVEVFIVNNQ